MISINLTPAEELEDNQWWIPDLLILLLVFGLSYGGVYYYSAMNKDELIVKEAEKQRITSEKIVLEADVKKFDSLNVKIKDLSSKKTALLRITESKLTRFLPIILLENIQNLKPDGIWLESLAFVDKLENGQRNSPADPQAQNKPKNPDKDAKSLGEDLKKMVGVGGEAKPKTGPAREESQNTTSMSQSQGAGGPITIEIVGKGKSNIAIAEFMMSLKATQTQRFEKSDLRTQLFFNEIAIAFTQVSSQPAKGNQAGPSGQALQKMENIGSEEVDFKLILSFRERSDSFQENVADFDQFIDDFKRNGQASSGRLSKAELHQ